MFRKLFFIATLLALSSIAALAQVSQTPKTVTHGTHDEGYPGPIPAGMTNGALYLTNLVDDKIEIYDETLTKVKEIAVPTITRPADYTVTREREIVQDADGGNWSYTGNWVENREEESSENASGACEMYFLDMTSGYEFDSPFYATQTLFNTDDAFEYIQPVYSSPTESWRSEEDRDGDGEIDKIVISYSTSIEGVNIVSETGKVQQSVNISNGLHGWDAAIAKIGETFYLTQMTDEYLEFYAIDPTTSSIKKVGSPIKTRVHPTLAGSNQQITVETAASNMPRTVVVNNAAGQTVWKQTIAAGQTSVQVDTSRLSPGVNVVKVSGDKESATNCKVIVK